MFWASFTKKENGGNKPLRELYGMHERYWGDKNHRPGDEWEGTKPICTKFEKEFNDIQNEANLTYLDSE